MALSLNMMPPELLAALAGRGPASPFGMMPTGKDQSRITGPGQSFADFGLMDDLIAGKPGQQAVRLPTMPLDPTDQVGLGAAAQLPPNAMPTQGPMPPMAPPPSGGTQDAMAFAPQQQGQQLPSFGMPPIMPQGSQQQGGGFQDWLTSLGRNPTFLAGLTTLGGHGPGAGASIASAYTRQAGSSDDIREYEYAKRQGFNGTFQDWVANKRAGAGEVSLNPIWGEDEQGNPVLGQLNKRGEFVQTKMPGGIKPSRGVDKIDLGTAWGVMDKGGQLIGTYPKDIKGKAEAEVVGRGQGEAAESFASMSSKMPGLETVVKELDELAKTATYTLGGQLIDRAMRESGMEPRAAAVARSRYISMVDNQILPLLRDTFGAQFTEREGQTLRKTLGDPDKTPTEKQAVLRSFIEQKRRDIEALARRTGQGAPAKRLRFNPATGELE